MFRTLLNFNRSMMSATMRSMKVRRQEMLRYRKHQLVSIHAPMKGATIPASNHASNHGVSIHAPMKGATRTVS